MKGDVEINYRGIAIKWQEWSGKFEVDGDKEYHDIGKACERIDGLLKVNIDKTPVFWEDYHKNPIKAIATSVNDAGEVFVSFPEKKGKYGSREKLSNSRKVFVDCPENREKYARVLEIRKEFEGVVAQYQAKADEITVTMQRIGGKVE